MSGPRAGDVLHAAVGIPGNPRSPKRASVRLESGGRVGRFWTAPISGMTGVQGGVPVSHVRCLSLCWECLGA